MIDFLKKYEISDNIIKEIMDSNTSANLYNFNCNQDDVGKIINYLRELGFNYINELIIYRIDLFFLRFDEFMEKFNVDNINKLYDLVDFIND